MSEGPPPLIHRNRFFGPLGIAHPFRRYFLSSQRLAEAQERVEFLERNLRGIRTYEDKVHPDDPCIQCFPSDRRVTARKIEGFIGRHFSGGSVYTGYTTYKSSFPKESYVEGWPCFVEQFYGDSAFFVLDLHHYGRSDARKALKEFLKVMQLFEVPLFRIEHGHGKVIPFEVIEMLEDGNWSYEREDPDFSGGLRESETFERKANWSRVRSGVDKSRLTTEGMPEGTPFIRWEKPTEWLRQHILCEVARLESVGLFHFQPESEEATMSEDSVPVREGSVQGSEDENVEDAGDYVLRFVKPTVWICGLLLVWSLFGDAIAETLSKIFLYVQEALRLS